MADRYGSNIFIHSRALFSHMKEISACNGSRVKLENVMNEILSSFWQPLLFIIRWMADRIDGLYHSRKIHIRLRIYIYAYIYIYASLHSIIICVTFSLFYVLKLIRWIFHHVTPKYSILTSIRYPYIKWTRLKFYA